eukprot:5768067-Prymnesium_polylepis.2
MPASPADVRRPTGRARAPAREARAARRLGGVPCGYTGGRAWAERSARRHLCTTLAARGEREGWDRGEREGWDWERVGAVARACAVLPARAQYDSSSWAGDVCGARGGGAAGRVRAPCESATAPRRTCRGGRARCRGSCACPHRARTCQRRRRRRRRPRPHAPSRPGQRRGWRAEGPPPKTTRARTSRGARCPGRTTCAPTSRRAARSRAPTARSPAAQHREVAQRRRRAPVLERAEEGVARGLVVAARPEALAEAVPRVRQRRVELDRVGQQPLRLLGHAAGGRARQRLAAQVPEARLQRAIRVSGALAGVDRRERH